MHVVRGASRPLHFHNQKDNKWKKQQMGYENGLNVWVLSCRSPKCDSVPWVTWRERRGESERDSHTDSKRDIRLKKSSLSLSLAHTHIPFELTSLSVWCDKTDNNISTAESSTLVTQDINKDTPIWQLQQTPDKTYRFSRKWTSKHPRDSHHYIMVSLSVLFCHMWNKRLLLNFIIKKEQEENVDFT